MPDPRDLLPLPPWVVARERVREIKAQVVSKAREAGFPGHIELREYMEFVEGLYDSGIITDEEAHVKLKWLRKDLPSYARGKPVIYIKYGGKTKKQVLAALAHELGHWELPVRPDTLFSPVDWIKREADAHFKGSKWARKWGVIPQYMSIEKQINEVLRRMDYPSLPPLGGRLGL